MASGTTNAGATRATTTIRLRGVSAMKDTMNVRTLGSVLPAVTAPTAWIFCTMGLASHVRLAPSRRFLARHPARPALRIQRPRRVARHSATAWFLPVHRQTAPFQFYQRSDKPEQGLCQRAPQCQRVITKDAPTSSATVR